MPNLTPNYNLKKPLGTESALISVLNENADTIDEVLAPTVDDTTTPSSSSATGLLATVLGWLANRIKAITGNEHWYDAPPSTLKAVAGHIGKGGETHPLATQETPGFMSAEDRLTFDTATWYNVSTALVKRDSKGRAQIADPSTSQEIANKNYVDTNLSSHKSSESAHPQATQSSPGFMSAEDKELLDTATSYNTANSLAKRDGNGRVQVATPSSNYDATPKTYVDTKCAVSNFFVTGTYVGDGEEEKAITLGFAPSCVIVTYSDGVFNTGSADSSDFQCGGMAVKGYNCLRYDNYNAAYLTAWDTKYCLIGLTTTGFRVSGENPATKVSKYSNANSSDETYFYIAFR